MPVADRVVYVISDLHLGGKPGESDGRGFRICTHERELTEFVDTLTMLNQPTVELVINGDVVDFLAEETGEARVRWSAFHFPQQKAVERLSTIVERSANFFQALSKFLATPRHRLVILPGNHDVELNLPAVRRRLREAVGANGAADYEFIGGGEAYRVGDVLIEHGNRVDDMNFVDYETLRHLNGLLSRGLHVADQFLFDPPAGSKLVAYQLNPIKQHYGFIDLLKPEQEAAFPVLLALEPGLRSELGRLAGALANGKRRRVYQTLSRRSNISARSGPAQPQTAEPISDDDALAAILERTVGRRQFGATEPRGSSARPIAAARVASMWKLLTGTRAAGWEERLPDLLDALREWRPTSDPFERSIEADKTYWDEVLALTQNGNGEIRHVVFGHTHLAKQVPLPDLPGCSYFNSGTWADLLSLPAAIMERNRQLIPLAELEKFVRDLLAQEFSHYVTFRPTYVRIEQDQSGKSLRAELRDYGVGEV